MSVKDSKKSVSKDAPEGNLARTVGLTKEIRAEAQKIFEDRQAKHLAGDENTDWLTAEAKIISSTRQLS
jgi:hypothetical protein